MIERVVKRSRQRHDQQLIAGERPADATTDDVRALHEADRPEHGSERADLDERLVAGGGPELLQRHRRRHAAKLRAWRRAGPLRQADEVLTHPVVGPGVQDEFRRVPQLPCRRIDVDDRDARCRRTVAEPDGRVDDHRMDGAQRAVIVDDRLVLDEHLELDAGARATGADRDHAEPPPSVGPAVLEAELDGRLHRLVAG